MRRKQLSPEPVEGSFTEGFKIQNGWRKLRTRRARVSRKEDSERCELLEALS